MKKEKVASILAFKHAQKISEIINTLNLETQEIKGHIMIASQLYFYSGENGLKYLLDLEGDMDRFKIIETIKKDGFKKIGENVGNIYELYLKLLPKSNYREL
jgi:hypothetical protein